jgi:hypothetical protein
MPGCSGLVKPHSFNVYFEGELIKDIFTYQYVINPDEISLPLLKKKRKLVEERELLLS